MRRTRRWGIIALITAMLMLGGLVGSAFLRPAHALDLGDVLRVGGIILVVSAFGNQINSFINSALGQREAATVGATKVVPIFSVGRGAYVGAAQVMGLPASVQRTQGVAAIELTVGDLEGSGLIPVTTRRPGRVLDRVSAVGISAIIDFRI
jgi:hypothetical protein